LKITALKIPDRVSFPATDIPADIDNKGKGKVDKYGRTKGEERNVDKEHTDLGAGNTHSFTQKGENTEHPYLCYLPELFDHLFVVLCLTFQT